MDMDTIYREYADPVFKYLMTLCYEEDTARELTQETFYQAVKSSGRYDGTCKVFTWLCQIAKHLWYQELDKRKRKGSCELDENLVSSDVALEDVVCIREDKMDIETQGGIATIRFTPKDDKHVLYVEAEEGEERTVVITEGRKNPFRKTYRQSAYYGLTFLDEHTVMGLNGESGTITEEDTLTKPAKSDAVDMTYHKDSNGTVT